MNKLYFGKSELQLESKKIGGSFIEQDGLQWYRIENYDQMDPFFISITSPEDFWMFLSTTGGLTCGRKDKDQALFPYGTDDKVSASISDTGPISYIMLTEGDKEYLWNPLNPTEHRVYEIQRNLYKTALGDRILFEEVNHSLNLTFQMSWETSPALGIHRKCRLINHSDRDIDLRILDGVRNILPAGVTAQTQGAFSNLLNAYKRSESEASTDLGIYTLSATLTDQAEPSESLKATTLWSYGLDDCTLLLSEIQLEKALKQQPLEPERDIKGERGAYLKYGEIHLKEGAHRTWGLVAELNKDHSYVIGLLEKLKGEKDSLEQQLIEDINASSKRLEQIIRMNDGDQQTGSRESMAHHQANVLFNIMRGGYFIDGYNIERKEFRDFVLSWNQSKQNQLDKALENLPDTMPLKELQQHMASTGDVDLRRYSLEYLPLTFGRRHGDPSRPWNQFLIETRDEEGHQKTGYQGNWRDIFQNWEALCFSYPGYYPSMISKFLNATTADGYNPYKISQHGIDWEVPNPDDPWANIGYWSDHQIIYLLKLLEQADNFQPQEIRSLLNEPIFVHAHVPYKIRSLEEVLKDPYNSIEFDQELHNRLMDQAEKTGADGKLLYGNQNTPEKSTMAEKLLLLFLAKLANYVPGGGIWMNTQRPEWNDANNALAGWGLSMVTLSYLVRYLDFLDRFFPEDGSLNLHSEAAQWLKQSLSALQAAPSATSQQGRQRYETLYALGSAASEYRSNLYSRGFSGNRIDLSLSEIRSLIDLSRSQFLDTIALCRRPDGSFESYQVLSVQSEQAEIKKLYPMLEGQVAGLSLNHYDETSTLQVLDNLKQGPLYRADQHSYMLYPNRDLPGFLSKNNITHKDVQAIAGSRDPKTLFKDILFQDVKGEWHFDGSYRNSKDLAKASVSLSEKDRNALTELFEKTFHHSEFTGRSGTFFAYEGLGSIYWHMVSKLLLAVQERLLDALHSNSSEGTIEQLKKKYIDLRWGIGFNKTPEVYGAFPCDPYSHSPWDKGAKQPGMTGQVKEEVLARFAELGMVVRHGCIEFHKILILEDQWMQDGCYSFSYCGVQIKVCKGSSEKILLNRQDDSPVEISDLTIPAEWSQKIFDRNGEISSIEVSL